MKYVSALFIIILVFASHSLAEQIKIGFLLEGGLGDQSFNDMAYQGMAKAKKRYNFKIFIEEPDDTRASRVAALKTLIAKGANFIIVNSWLASEVILTYARNHPDVYFLKNDVAVSGPPNVSSTVYGQHEGSFLAGVLAGRMTRSKKVGFIGGMALPVIQAFRVGFLEGLAYADKSVALTVDYVSSGNDYSGFENPRKGFKLAEAQYQNGIDIIFGVAGLTGNGIIHAVKTYKKYMIGVDANQDHLAKGLILTSMMKRLDIATFKEISDFMEGRFKPGVKYYGIKEGGVSLTPMTYTKQLLPDGLLTELQTIEEKIKSGQIRVTNYLDQNPQ